MLIFDENRAEGGLFRIATTASGFNDLWHQATHVGYGVPVSSAIEIFAFVEGEKDTVAPEAFSPFWSGRLVKEPLERYTII